MISLAEENYLKALFSLSNEKGEVNVNDLSKHLKVKMPTVTNMMKKLSIKKLVHYERYKPLRLTEKGKKEAGLIIRKHRLTEMYLVEKMGFGWEEVHLIAEQIEHIKSTIFFSKIDELLDYPKLDPHGSPIPNENGKIILKKYDKLSLHKQNDVVKIVSVISNNDEFLKYLNKKEIFLGLKMTIKHIEQFDNTMTVNYYKHSSEMLSSIACERLLVEKV